MNQTPVIVTAPWPLTKLAETLDRTPESLRVALCRGKLTLKPKRILGRLYFQPGDVARLLAGHSAAQSNQPILTTPQVAKLAGVELSAIYTSVQRVGNWRDIHPLKLANGRYRWLAPEVHRALGLVPDASDMPPGERAFADFCDREGIALTTETLKLGRALLSADIDIGRDPAFYADDLPLLVELTDAFCNRLSGALPAMDEASKRRAFASLRMVSSMATCFDGVDVEVRHV